MYGNRRERHVSYETKHKKKFLKERGYSFCFLFKYIIVIEIFSLFQNVSVYHCVFLISLIERVFLLRALERERKKMMMMRDSNISTTTKNAIERLESSTVNFCLRLHFIYIRSSIYIN